MSNLRTYSGRLNALRRHHPDVDHSDAERELKVVRAEQYIADLVKSAPPLRPEDLDRLRALLPPAPASKAGETDAA